MLKRTNLVNTRQRLVTCLCSLFFEGLMTKQEIGVIIPPRQYLLITGTKPDLVCQLCIGKLSNRDKKNFLSVI